MRLRVSTPKTGPYNPFCVWDIAGAGMEYGEQYSAYEVGYQEKPSVAR
jgi:hypothetical protein